MNKTTASKDSIENWMSSPVLAVDRKSSVRHVLEIMKNEGVSSIPVVDADGHVIGIVTLGDLARVVLSTDKILDSDYPRYEDCYWAVDLIQKRFGSDTVTTLMSENVTGIRPDQSMNEAAKIMLDKDIQHLVVVSDQQLAGILSASDFVRFAASGV